MCVSVVGTSGSPPSVAPPAVPVSSSAATYSSVGHGSHWDTSNRLGSRLRLGEQTVASRQMVVVSGVPRAVTGIHDLCPQRPNGALVGCASSRALIKLDWLRACVVAPCVAHAASRSWHYSSGSQPVSHANCAVCDNPEAVGKPSVGASVLCAACLLGFCVMRGLSVGAAVLCAAVSVRPPVASVPDYVSTFVLNTGPLSSTIWYLGVVFIHWD